MVWFSSLALFVSHLSSVNLQFMCSSSYASSHKPLVSAYFKLIPVDLGGFSISITRVYRHELCKRQTGVLAVPGRLRALCCCCWVCCDCGSLYCNCLLALAVHVPAGSGAAHAAPAGRGCRKCGPSRPRIGSVWASTGGGLAGHGQLAAAGTLQPCTRSEFGVPGRPCSRPPLSRQRGISAAVADSNNAGLQPNCRCHWHFAMSY